MIVRPRRALAALILLALAVSGCGGLPGPETGSGHVDTADGRVMTGTATDAPGGAAGAGAPSSAGPSGGGADAPGSPVAAAARTSLAAGGPRLSPAATLAGLRLMNYQPADGGWPLLWTDWHPDRVDRDLAQIAALGGTTVRVSLIPDALGWPAPEPQMQARLARFVDLAAAHGLAVQLTVFDWFGRLDRVGQSRSWARAVLAPYRDDRRVVLVELLNEVDPDDARTVTWLKALLPTVRTALPGVPRTVSVRTTAGPQALGRLVRELPGLLEVADIHYYGEAATASDWLRQARTAAGGLPLLVGEAGLSLRYPTDTGRGVRHHEELQAVWFDAVLRAGRDQGVPIGVWMLSDLRPGAIPGHAEAEQPQEYRFGLRRLDGTLRPAAAVVRSWWTGTPPRGFADRFDTATDDGLPSGWRVDLPDGARYARDASVGASAPGSARISAAYGDPLHVPNLFRLVPIDVRAGATVRVSARVRAPGPGRVTVALGWHDASGRYLGGPQSGAARHGGWTTVTATGTAPAAARTVVVYLKASGVTGAAWFDDVQVGPA